MPRELAESSPDLPKVLCILKQIGRGASKGRKCDDPDRRFSGCTSLAHLFPLPDIMSYLDRHSLAQSRVWVAHVHL